ncbi:MAG: DUF805 domain-containing protein [Marinibacterium sp.]|nr:DUF805 domain-containing protein [Marinibacterium sp.]
MGFIPAVTTCFKKYVTFSGRASRSEYWWFFLFCLLGNLVATVLDVVLFGSVAGSVATTDTSTSASASADSNGLIGTVFGIVIFLPQLAAAWRRMHDSGRSGLFALLPTLMVMAAGAVLIFGLGLAGMFAHGGSMDVLFTRATLLILIPTVVVLIISPLLVLFWLTRPSQPGTNAYGPNPHEVSQ